MNAKTICLIGIAMMPVVERVQAQVTLNYDFTLNPGYTLNHVYIVDTVPSGYYAAFVQVPGSFSNAGQNPVTDQGSITLGYAIGNQYLTLLAVFTDPSQNQGVAMSLPVSLANSLGSEASWTTINTSPYFTPMLPDEQDAAADLANNEASLFFSFDYMPATDPILTAPINVSIPGESSTSGEIVAFDGAENMGSVTISVPEPSSLSLFGLGLPVIGLLIGIHQKAKNNSDKAAA